MERRTKVVRVLLTPTQRKELEGLAAKQQRSMSDMLAWLLVKALEKEKAS